MSAMFLLSGCATFMERSDLNYASILPPNWKCIDRNDDGKSDGALKIYPATKAGASSVSFIVKGFKKENFLLPFVLIDLPISITEDTFMYYHDSKSAKEYEECMAKRTNKKHLGMPELKLDLGTGPSIKFEVRQAHTARLPHNSNVMCKEQ